MNIRGHRECKECNTRWSYFETGAVSCPACGSLRSVGRSDRVLHTDRPVEFDLTAVQQSHSDSSLSEFAAETRAYCRRYLSDRGFIRGGTLGTLDDQYLVVNELLHVADELERALRSTDPAELYFLSLVRTATDGIRPPPEEVPQSLYSARGLAYTTAISAYRRDVRTWLERQSIDPVVRSAIERLDAHVTRIRLLDGDISPTDAERLIEATRALGDYLRGDADSVEPVEEQLDGLV